MALGKMTKTIDIISTTPIKDSEGFATESDTVIATVKAYKEERRGSEKWANMAVFSEAGVLFRFRRIPGVVVKDLNIIVCDSGRYKIVDVQTEASHGMYVECLCAMTEGSC